MMKYRRYCLPDLVFLLVVVLALVLGLLFFLCSHFLFLRGSGGTAGAATTAAMGLDVAGGGFPISLPNPLAPITDAIKVLSQNALAWLDRQGSLLIFTDPAATYGNPDVQAIWRIVLVIADGTLGIFIVLAGYQIILAGFSSRGYAEALEALPTLIFAAIGANASLLFARFWVDLNNLLCAALLTQAQMNGGGSGGSTHALSAFQTMVLVAVATSIALPLVALLVLLLVLLGVQMAVRLGVLIFLTVWLPLLFVMLSHNVTRRYGQAGLTGYATAALTQVLQLSALILGERTLLPFLAGNIGPSSALAPIAQILASIALLWLTLRIPAMLRSWALQPVAESAQAVRSLIFASFVRMLP